MTLDVYRGRKTTIQQQTSLKLHYPFMHSQTTIQQQNNLKLHYPFMCSQTMYFIIVHFIVIHSVLPALFSKVHDLVELCKVYSFSPYSIYPVSKLIALLPSFREHCPPTRYKELLPFYPVPKCIAIFLGVKNHHTIFPMVMPSLQIN